MESWTWVKHDLSIQVIYNVNLCVYSMYIIESCYISKKGFPGSSAGKELACNAGDPNSIPG